MLKNRIGMALVAAVAWSSAAEATYLVKVTGDRVNLRAKPTLTAETVGQVRAGDILIARSFKEEWVEVVPDDKLDFWVHSDFVKNGEVTATTLNVRAGAGINYSTVGVLERGDRVDVRGTFGDWLKVAPPLGASLWISGKLVELMNREHTDSRKWTPAEKVSKPAEEPRTVEVAEREPGVRDVPAPREPAPKVEKVSTGTAGLKLVPLEGQGATAEKKGVLKRAGFLNSGPTDYLLVQDGGYRAKTVCYVRGNVQQLESFIGTAMTIRGQQYWVQGVRHPVLVPEQIIPAARQ
jgi:uncharacterized protein YraI